jgi:hypothetical protein
VSCSLHDLAEYEAYGIPSVLIASDEFVSAADAQGVALGTSPAVVYVEHPIQSRTDAEMEKLADEAVDRVIAGLTEDSP